MKTSITRVLFLFFIFFSTVLFSSPLKAADNPVDYRSFTKEEIKEAIKDCPESIQFSILQDYDNSQGWVIDPENPEADPQPANKYPLSGRLVAYIKDGKPVLDAQCSTLKGIEKLFLRFYGIVISIIGLAFVYSVGKSTIQMMWKDKEGFEEGVESLKKAVTYLVGFFFAYLTITFIITGILGAGTSSNNQWNIICQNRIVFDITFGDGNTNC